MKTKCLKFLLAAGIVFAATAFANAQSYREDPRYGATPEEREQNVLILNYFNDAFANKDYENALGYLRTLLAKAPKSSQNIYIKGATILGSKVEGAKDAKERNAYVDTLMNLYDQRIANFGTDAAKTASILTYKVTDYATYRPDDKDGVRKMYKDAVTMSGTEVDFDFLNTYFNLLADEYKMGLIDVDLLLEEYDDLIVNFDQGEQTPEKEEAKKVFESIFISSGAANCENIEKIYKPRVAANPTDTLILSKAYALLERGKCESDFKMEVAEKFFAVKPSANTAIAIANEFEKRKETAKAMQYLQEAVNNETNSTDKANLYVRMGGMELSANNASKAAEYARQATALNPENGYAFMILAQAYAVGLNACSGFDRQAGYWLAYDILSRARNLMSDSEQTRNADSQLASFRSAFPTKEECFFRGINEGDSYTVRCGWVSGSTTVRTIR